MIVQVLYTQLFACKDNAQLFKLCCTESEGRNKILKRGLFSTHEGQSDGDFDADLTRVTLAW